MRFHVFGLVFAAGCATTTNASETPDWVTYGTGAAILDDQPVLVAVGEVSDLKSEALAETMAKNRAKAELAKIFEVFTAGLTGDYVKTQKELVEERTAALEETGVAHVIQHFSATALGEAEVTESWSQGGTYYARAVLPLEAFLRSVDTLEAPDWPGIHDYFRDQAAPALERMRSEHTE